MRIELDKAADHWGVKVEQVEVKDVHLPVHLQRAMATEAEAAREAGARVNKENIFKQFNCFSNHLQKASRALREVAEVALLHTVNENHNSDDL